MTDYQCKFCDSQKTQEFLVSFNTHGRYIINTKEKFSIRKCLDCDCLFIAPIRIDQDYYDKYYEPNYYSGGVDSGIIVKSWTFVYNLLFKKREKYILSYFKDKKSKISILDIGCGNGDFLAGLDANKFEKNGVEINPQGIGLCREKNINVYEKDVRLIDFEGKKFDVITLWHVLEHLEKPLEVFAKAKEILTDQGILVFQVPNNKSIGFKFGREYWFHLDSPRHLVIPCKKTIFKACQKTGLNIAEIKNEFYDYPLDLLWSVRKSWVRIVVYPLYPFFKLLSREHLTFCIKKK